MESSGINHKKPICESFNNKKKNASESKKTSPSVSNQPKRSSNLQQTFSSDPAFCLPPPPISIQSKKLAEFDELEEKVEKDKNKSSVYENNKEQAGGAKTETTFVTEFDPISTGLPSDFPSDFFDIEGDLVYGDIHNLRFGLEDDDFSSADDNDQDGGTTGNHAQIKNLPDKDFNKKNEVKSTQGKAVVYNPKSSSSPKHFHESRYENKQYQTLGSSKKLAPILSTCESSSYTSKGKEKASWSADVDDKFRESACDSKPTNKHNFHRVIQKQTPVEDLYHPLLINGNVSKDDSDFPRLVARRTLLSSRKSSANNTFSNNSGNLSPPSDQFRSPIAPFDRHHSSGGASSSNSSSTITQHYYPEGGWGYVVLVTCTICHILTSGFQLSFGVLWQAILEKFGNELHLISCWLGAVSLGISLLFSPVWVSICKKKSTRLSAVFGGLVASLGCLFTSLASQFHQTFISYGVFLGVGVGLSRDASSLMVGQYFKRKRELVEIIVVSGSGLGIIIMSISIHTAIGSLGWRLGLQAVTVSLILTFFLGTCYRSASLYHPQRRAILHLKNQKRKVKEKGKRDDRPPFIDYSCLRSKTLRIILMSSACTAFGIFTPLLSLAVQCSKTGFEDCSILMLHIYIGTSWVFGCCLVGLVVIQKSQDCRVSKQYLCQVASLICGISILALTAVKGTNGMVVFCWVYGASLGGYCYCLKVYTYERARARHFPRAYSFLQSSQSIPLIFGVPLTNYANEMVGWKSGFYMSAMAVFVGTACLFLTDVRRRKLSRIKSQNSSMKTCETTDGGTSSPKSKRLSFAFPVELAHQQECRHDSDDEEEPGGPIDPSVMIKELTCISEEGLVDVDFQDIYFDEWAEYIGECITSCNKVENCLVSEYDPDLAMIVERRARRWSAAKQNVVPQQQHSHYHHQPQVNPLLSHVTKGTAGTTGRLTLPGIGTVLEVPLLVAKRLHPNVGARSHLPLHHHHHLDHNSGQQYTLQQQQQHRQVGLDSFGNSDSVEYSIKRARNLDSLASNDKPGSSSGSIKTRIYGKPRAPNLAASHFPAIDEDSV